MNPYIENIENAINEGNDLDTLRGVGIRGDEPAMPNCISHDYGRDKVTLNDIYGDCIESVYALKREEMEPEPEQQVRYIEPRGFDYSDRVFGNESTDKP